jgi:apolipoprotein N-acyltransferase
MKTMKRKPSANLAVEIQTKEAPRLAPVRCPLPWLAAPLVSAGVLWACFFPLSWGWLSWIALIPFLTLARSQARPALVYLGAYVSGAIWFICSLQWMRVADERMAAAWVALGLYCAAYFPLAIALIRMLESRWRWPLLLSVPVAWVALEFLRSFFLTGFAWYFLGHAQHRFLEVIQIADLGGAYLVSFLVALVNGWCADLLFQLPQVQRFLGLRARLPGASAPTTEPKGPPASVDWRWIARWGLLVVLLLAATFAYGVGRISQEKFRMGPLVGLLQGNLDQRFRNAAAVFRGDAPYTMWKHHAELAKHLMVFDPQPEMMIWPETSFGYTHTLLPEDLRPVSEGEKRHVELVGKLVRGTTTETRSAHLLGLNLWDKADWKNPRHFNSALLVDRKGWTMGRYDKMHRVPFGEYVPLVEVFPFLQNFAPYDDIKYAIIEGEKFTRFTLRTREEEPGTENKVGTGPPSTMHQEHQGASEARSRVQAGGPELVQPHHQRGEYRFGVLTCFEDTDPFLARQYGREHADGPTVDFLVNMSNDGWFDGTCEHEEHLAISRFRAIETRRALVRSVNMGISGVIDGSGRVLKPTLKAKKGIIHLWAVEPGKDSFPALPVSEWGEFKKVAGAMQVMVPLDDRTSWYPFLGDWLPLGCWAILGLGLVMRLTQRFRKQPHADPAPQGYHVDLGVPS